ncbi:transposase [Arcobacteraceae bacterium]|nr:transposase [Arcobacteraceae bacterium]
MLKYFMNCPYCHYHIIYTLNTTQKKCAKCLHKFSEKKILFEKKIINLFCENITVNQCAKNHSLNYVTVKKRYDKYRKLIASYLEEQYHNKQVIEYDEYIYLEQSKKQIKQNIFDAVNFMTFNYEDKVYNLLMPNLHKYKNQFLDDAIEESYFKKFSTFMLMNKISKIEKKENIIASFWIYFEESIVKYKGINNENFFYYLKEIEFKFNYSLKEQENILNTLVK